MFSTDAFFFVYLCWVESSDLKLIDSVGFLQIKIASFS